MRAVEPAGDEDLAVREQGAAERLARGRHRAGGRECLGRKVVDLGGIEKRTVESAGHQHPSVFHKNRAVELSRSRHRARCRGETAGRGIEDLGTAEIASVKSAGDKDLAVRQEGRGVPLACDCQISLCFREGAGERIVNLRRAVHRAGVGIHPCVYSLLSPRVLRQCYYDENTRQQRGSFHTKLPEHVTHP